MEFAQKTRSDKSPNICQLATFYKSCMHLVHKNISIGLFDNGKRSNGNWFYPLWKLIGFTIGCSIKFAIITNECCFNTVEKKDHLQIAIENISYRQRTTFSIDWFHVIIENEMVCGKLTVFKQEKFTLAKNVREINAFNSSFFSKNVVFTKSSVDFT